MRKRIVEVPEGVEYISQWTDFTYPMGKIIVDKQICGCGFTEYCLRNKLPIILCSPRKALLENKASQHPDEVYYFKNEKEVDTGSLEPGPGLKRKDIEKIEALSKEIKKDYLKILKRDLLDWLKGCVRGKVPKILVTYDSLKYVLDALGLRADKYYVVVDEFQSIFTDSHFKSEVENTFLTTLSSLRNVMYLSATPMMDKYLSLLPEFADLDYLELHWPKDMVQTVSITRKRSYSLAKDVSKIIQDYKSGNFPKKIYPGGEVAVSKEIVFYMNSVKDILGVITSNKLTADEVNIICAENVINTKKMKKTGHTYGKIPLKGDPHKMFTFCTRTTFLGADFYSPCASTVICSDCKVTSLSLDISLDLPQIIGRQRLKGNAFKNECLFLYRVHDKDEDWRTMEWDVFNAKVEEKRKVTNSLLQDWTTLSNLSQKGFLSILKKAKARMVDKYDDDYLGLINEGNGGFTYNFLAELAEIRAFEVTRDQYLNSFVVKKSLELVGFDTEPEAGENNVTLYPDINLEYLKFIEEFNSYAAFHKKMIAYCTFLLKYYDLIKTTDIEGVPQEYQNYVNLLGPQKVYALEGVKKALEEEYQFVMNRQNICDALGQTLIQGSRYLRTDMKALFVEIYKNLGIPRTGKASDISLFCDIKEVYIPTPDGPKRGFEIL